MHTEWVSSGEDPKFFPRICPAKKKDQDPNLIRNEKKISICILGDRHEIALTISQCIYIKKCLTKYTYNFLNFYLNMNQRTKYSYI